MTAASTPEPAATAAAAPPALAPLRFWFDPISPYAYLAFERLPQVLEGVSHAVEYKPVLFAGLLEHWGQLGPAEIAPKRDWTWRQVAWLAARDAVPWVAPPRHPFNPLPLLRLLLATVPEGGTPGRWACERVFHQAWRSGAPADDAQVLARLREELTCERPLAREPESTSVKQQLRRHGEEALQRGVFGVPTVELVASGRCFWGQEALPMLRQALLEPASLDAAWAAPAAVGPGIRRAP